MKWLMVKMECWNDGIMERWSNGVMECWSVEKS